MGNGVCQWNFTVTFTESAGADVTITKLDIWYTDTKGSVWTSSGGETYDVGLDLPGNGSVTYDSWVSTTAGERPDLRGGKVSVRYYGYAGTNVEAPGGALPGGSVSATLSR